MHGKSRASYGAPVSDALGDNNIMGKQREIAILILSFLLVPALVAAVYLTEGTILPRIKTYPVQTWNIQYIPSILIAAIGTLIAYFGIKRKVFRKSYICSFLFNLFWGFFTFTR